jgi:hypothetical protein
MILSEKSATFRDHTLIATFAAPHNLSSDVLSIIRRFGTNRTCGRRSFGWSVGGLLDSAIVKQTAHAGAIVQRQCCRA